MNREHQILIPLCCMCSNEKAGESLAPLPHTRAQQSDNDNDRSDDGGDGVKPSAEGAGEPSLREPQGSVDTSRATTEATTPTAQQRGLAAQPSSQHLREGGSAHHDRSASCTNVPLVDGEEQRPGSAAAPGLRHRCVYVLMHDCVGGEV